MSVLGGRTLGSKMSKVSDGSSSFANSSSWVLRAKGAFYDSLTTMMSYDSKFLPWGLFTLEIVFMILTLGVLIHPFMDWVDDGSDIFVKWLGILVHSVDVVTDITTYTVMFIISGIWILGVVLVFIYVLMTRSENVSLMFISFLQFRVTRTVLLFMLVSVFGSPVRCNYFDGSFLWELFEEQGFSSLQFPFSLFFVFGIIFWVCTIGIGVIDVVFLCDRLRNIKYLTVSSDGRFMLIVFAVVATYDILEEAVHGLEHFLGAVIGIGSILGFSFFCVYLILWIAHWRILPFYNRVYSFVFSGFLAVCCFLCLSVGIVNVAKTGWAYFCFTSIIVGLIFNFIAMVIRYKLVHRHFSSGKIKHNWLCSSSHDICSIAYLTKKSSAQVLQVIKNVKFAKSRRVCYMLAGLLMHSNLSVASQIIRHSDAILGERTFYDTEFFVYFYRNKINEESMLGNAGHRKLQRMINRTKRWETQLKRLYRKFFGILLQDERDFSKLPSIFTSIFLNLENCDKTYRTLIQLYPSELVFRRFANYLEKFRNDKKAADLFINQASDMESDVNTFSDGLSSHASISGEIEVTSSYSSEQIASTPVETFTVKPVSRQNRSSVIRRSCSDGAVQDLEMSDKRSLKRRRSIRARPKKRFGKTPRPGPSLGSDVSGRTSATGPSDHGNSVAGRSIGSVRDDNISDCSALDRVGQGKKRGNRKSIASKMSGYRDLMNKLSEKRHWSMQLTRGVVCLLALFVVLLVVVACGLAIRVSNEFTQSTEFLRLGIHAREEVISIRLYLRKMQVSLKGNETTPIDHQRDFDAFRELFAHTCEGLMKAVKSVFKNSDERYLRPFTEHVTIHEQNLENRGVHKQDMSLFDAIVLYAQKCRKIIEQFYSKEEADAALSVLNNYTILDSETSNFDIFDKESFFFIMKNEHVISHGLDEVISTMNKVEEQDSKTFMYVFFALPTLVFVFFLVILCVYFILWAEQKRMYKGLSLLPREEILEKFKYYGGTIEGSEENDSESASASVGNKMTLLTRFFFQGSFVLVLSLLVVVFFSIIIAFTATRFIERNHNFETLTQVEVHTRDIHGLMMEALYPESSIFDQEEIFDEISMVEELVEEEYYNLRFEEGGLNRIGYGKDFLYDNKCIHYEFHDDDNSTTTIDDDDDHDIQHRRMVGIEKEEREMAENYACLSLNDLIMHYFEDMELLYHSLKENLTHDELLHLRGSEHWQSFLVLEDYHGGMINEYGGVMKYKMILLGNIVRDALEDFISLISNSSTLMIIFFLPAVFLYMLVFFRGYASRIANYIIMPKHMILLFSKQLLCRGSVYQFLMSDSSFRSIWKNRTSAQRKDFYSIVQRSEYAVLVFNRKFVVSYANRSAREMFDLNSLNFRLEDVVSKTGFRKIKRFSRRSVGEPFFDTVRVRVNGYEFGVNWEINRNADTFVCILENLEKSKKKKVLEVAEARNSKMNLLLRSIFPKSVAENIKLKDRHNFVSTHKEMTAIFVDIANFTKWSTTQESEKMVKTLNSLFSRYDGICEQNACEKIKTIGDGYFAVCGVPTYCPQHAKNAMNFAICLLEDTAKFNDEDNQDFHIRIGIASGSCVAGIIGKTKFAFDVWGPVINLAARMEENCSVDHIQVARSTYELVFDEYKFVERDLNIKGVGCVKGYLLDVDQNDITDNDDDAKEEEEEEDVGDGGEEKDADQSTSSHVVVEVDENK